MSETEKLLDRKDANDIQVYQKRWILVIMIGFQTIIIRYFMNSFGIVNEIYSSYFQISYIAIDWFTIVQFPGSVLGNVLLAYLFQTTKFGFRKLSLGVGIVSVFTNAAILIAFLLPALYPLIFIGEFLLGVCYTALLTMFVQLGHHWFPLNQVGFAVSFFPIFTTCSALLAFVIPTTLYLPPPRLNLNNSTSSSINYTNENWFEEDKKRSLILSGASLSILIFLLVSLYKSATDYPPKPPTVAQMLFRQRLAEDDTNNKKSFFGGFKSFMKECKLILIEKVMLQIAFIASVRYCFVALQVMFMGQILRESFSPSKALPDIDVLSGYILLGFELAGLIGTALSGKVFDHFKQHRIQVAISMLMLFLASCLLAVGYYLSNIAILVLSNVILGFFLDFPTVVLYDAVVKQLYPKKPGLVTAVLGFEFFTITIIFSEITRFVLKFAGGMTVITFPAFFHFIALILSCFLKPNYKNI